MTLSIKPKVNLYEWDDFYVPRENAIYFVRHAESTANAGGLSVQHALIPLSETGILQAQDLASTLNVRPGLVLSSEFIRTQQTAQPFCEIHQCEFKVEPLLNEFSALSRELIIGMMGNERRPFADAYWAEADVSKRMGVEAETFLEFNNRVAVFLNKMEALPNNTVVFGHGIWFGLLVWLSMGFNAKDSTQMKAFRRFQLALPLSNCVIYKVTHSNYGWKVGIYPLQ